MHCKFDSCRFSTPVYNIFIYNNNEYIHTCIYLHICIYLGARVCKFDNKASLCLTLRMRNLS